ncbi:hypothetical protein [Humisphaera borealis]|uniref:Uncharacterized protein n=1 Tax=Humisphaera borealis TaxID=2807512 RepID=A0A7M2WQF2_9BACT|nr:hypothetical protein [Humisphaera borealis]QOV87765.1 hypothetical protein IPV69_15905 [Humisphaera borealis]
MAIAIATLGAYVMPVFGQQVELSLPLEGYCRLGKATAIHISAEGLAASRLLLNGEGLVPVQVPATAGRVEATVPVMTQGLPPDRLTWTAGRQTGSTAITVRSLRTDERLVAVAGDSADAKAFAASLFSDKKPVLVTIDTNRPRLLWPPQAYDAADAVLLDQTSAARVDEAQLRVLLAAGTTVAIRSSAKPLGQWPWQQQGGWWVLRHAPVGPYGGVNVDAYDPTYAWDRSWPKSDRRTILLVCLLTSLVVAGASLWRGKGGFIAATVVCVCGVAGAAFYVMSLRPAVFAGGDVVIWNGSLSQRDRWTYVSAFREAHLSVEAADRMRPVLGSRGQLATLGLTLTCDATGNPDRYEFNLGTRNTIAFVSRSVSPSPPSDTQTRAEVRIDLIADKLYPGKVADQTATVPADVAGEWWGAVVMRP